jgi:hypothetical protein
MKITDEVFNRFRNFRTVPNYDWLPQPPLPMSAPGVPMGQSVSYDALYGPPSGRKVI